ncbi:ABC transporter ATP-binding protein [Chondrinema litorale]|uniref:ABC transporter ATP-binding protein n=1 Tax=Chondrinema litorale TaxID=2994555 RepID=UPI002542C554|nr:ABC transporter ATP-binding protein [Chondrinema litorale]UZR94055.1 ABC transporter ATP-binding protein [Chondrinema litorale]
MLLQLINVEKTYSNFGIDTVALNDINLTIKKGEFVSIMGPSGCGKTSLLNIMGLLDKPTKGEVIFHGEVTSNTSNRKRAFLRRNHIGFVFQSFNLIEELTIYENIELPLMYLKVPSNERKRRVGEVMERLHIAHKSNFFPQQISGGQQQRAAVARALIAKPSLILADEPTGNLDSARGQEVMEMLVELNESGTSIVMVTHSSTAAEYSQRIIHLFDGQLVTENLKKVTN